MKSVIALLISILVVGCGGRDDAELKAWMANAGTDAKGKIPPLPDVRPYEPVVYDGMSAVDPFKPAKISTDRKTNVGGFQPNFERPREPLEAFPLESLKYVGVLTKNKVSYAIVLADGTLYQVKVGNYVGQNFGVITKITEAEVSLKELVEDSAGEWAERVSALLLQEQPEGKK